MISFADRDMFVPRVSCYLLLAVPFVAAAPAAQQGFDSATIAKVQANMLKISTHRLVPSCPL